MVELVGISKTYANGKRVLQNINVKFGSGLVHLVVGKNGSGKTTLLRIIAGLSLQNNGECNVESQKNLICFLSTVENQGFPLFTGEEYFKFFLGLYGISKSEAISKINSFRGKNETVDSALACQYQLCSAGMKQALRLAAILSVNADIYLLDEPLRSLDPDLCDFFKNVIESTSIQKIVIMTSHQALPFPGNRVISHQLEGGAFV